MDGLQYSSSTTAGITDENGFFTFTPGQDITFFVGDIVLGTLSPQTLLSPVSLVEGANDFADETVIINVARFLQTIDSDATASNGIQITPAVRNAAVGQTIDFESADFDTDLDVQATIAMLTSNPIVSEADAREHGDAWLAASRAGEYGGSWQATSGGTQSGQWKVSVSNSSSVLLIANWGSKDYGGLSGLGGGHNVTAQGNFEVVTDVADYNGSIVGSSLSGTWTGKAGGPLVGVSGTFSGSLQHEAMAFLDVEHIDNFEGLDGQTITGIVFDDGVDPVAAFTMEMNGNSEGLYEVSMIVTFYWGPVEHASFYATSMTAESIQFRGLCTSGEGFSGELHKNGDATGVYYNLDTTEEGGTFSGSL